jgi:HD-GYP domain-containing protein (c-di-GMP phosphodiesterase class II)
MTAERPYRGPMTQDAAVAELRANMGSQFDGAAVEALIVALPVLNAGLAPDSSAGDSEALAHA